MYFLGRRFFEMAFLDFTEQCRPLRRSESKEHFSAAYQLPPDCPEW